MQVNRSTHYYQAVPALDEMLLANEIHELWLEFPYYGYRRITAELQRRKHNINHKRVIRMMREMRLQALYPKPKTTLRNPDHKIYPYLLQGLKIMRPNQVWATDITYIRMPNGFMYLVALIDLFSRYIIEWNFSNTLSTDFVVKCYKGLLLEVSRISSILIKDVSLQAIPGLLWSSATMYE